MIDLTDLCRVRLQGGTHVHRATLAPVGWSTACGRLVLLTGPTGRPYDQPHPPDAAVTCPACARADHRENPTP